MHTIQTLLFTVLLMFPLIPFLVFCGYTDLREDVDVDIHSGTGEVLPAIDEPLERRDDGHDAKGGKTVVWSCY